MQDLSIYLHALIAQGGPQPHQYHDLNDWFARLLDRISGLSDTEIARLWDSLDNIFSPHTLQGFSARKPHGYAGDFEIIDRIYTRHRSTDPALAKWDEFFHWQAACDAVRNRKDYFKTVLRELEAGKPAAAVLEIGCGSCRGIHEYLLQYPDSRLTFDCVDMDAKAIAYARQLLGNERITFHHGSIFRLVPQAGHYDLVWSAGLFDYLDDRAFVVLLKKLAKALRPHGELVIGNFTEPNASRGYMEFGRWCLIHRSAAQLASLAHQAGLNAAAIDVRSEATGVNLFLHIRLG